MSRSESRAIAASRWFAAVALLALAAPASACDGHAFVRVAIAPLPPELEGMRFEFHQTMGPQLVVDNPTPRTLEILDADGIAFARVRGDGVEANLGARSWYTSYGPAAVIPDGLKSESERWTRASAGSSYGWFESRLEPAKVALAPEVIAAGRSTELAAWSLPLRVDGVRVDLRGSFRYEPPPTGSYRARLTSARQIVPGVRVRLLPGESPGLMVESASAQPLVIFGAAGEAFLRFGNGGVDANLRSPTWQRSGRGGERNSVEANAEAPPLWRKVSNAPRYSWIEPRAQRKTPPSDTAAPPSFTWRIPARLGDEAVSIEGESTWTVIEQVAAR